MRLTILAMLLLAVRGGSHAATAPAETTEFRRCMDAVDLSAFKNSQWQGCYEAELKRQDAVLNAAYKTVQAAAAPEARALLVKGQKAWLAYREAWCRFEETTPNAPGGTVNYAACLVELTVAQIRRLKESGGG
jgi:uncharacterized protein YecT (DUF1311 family)